MKQSMHDALLLFKEATLLLKKAIVKIDKAANILILNGGNNNVKRNTKT